MEIILLRHGKPVIPPLVKTNALAFNSWVDEYNRAGLANTSIPPEDAISIAMNCKAVVCSALPRSVESARTISDNQITLSSALFNEAGLPTANWKALKLSPKAWAILFRVMWLLGYSRNSESYKEAKERAVKCIKTLEQLAHTHERVLCVGHGVYNRILANELRRQNWLGPQNPGTKHWSYSVYTK